MTPDERAESIRRRMAELRRELALDVRDVGRSARAMTNPSFYVRKFPWTTLAIAAAAGFMLIPKKKQVIQPDPDMLAEMVRKKQVKLDTSKAAKGSTGLLETVIMMGLSWGARAGMNYFTQQFTAAADKKANTPKPQPASPMEQTGQSKR